MEIITLIIAGVGVVVILVRKIKKHAHNCTCSDCVPTSTGSIKHDW